MAEEVALVKRIFGGKYGGVVLAVLALGSGTIGASARTWLGVKDYQPSLDQINHRLDQIDSKLNDFATRAALDSTNGEVNRLRDSDREKTAQIAELRAIVGRTAKP